MKSKAVREGGAVADKRRCAADCKLKYITSRVRLQARGKLDKEMVTWAGVEAQAVERLHSKRASQPSSNSIFLESEVNLFSLGLGLSLKNVS